MTITQTPQAINISIQERIDPIQKEIDILNKRLSNEGFNKEIQAKINELTRKKKEIFYGK